MRYRAFLLLLFSLTVASLVHAAENDVCTQCHCGEDVSPAGIMMPRVHNKNEWMLSYRVMHMSMAKLQRETSPVAEETLFNTYLMAPTAMQMDMHMLSAMYGITDNITLMTMFRYQASSMRMNMYSAASHTADNHSGAGVEMVSSSDYMGDVDIMAAYEVLNTGNHNLMAGAGFSIPLGSINLTGDVQSMYAKKRLPYMMQTGSGTWDLMPMIGYLYTNDFLTAGLQSQAIVRNGINANGYRLGDEVLLTTWVSSRWCRFLSSSLRMEASASESIVGRDLTLYTMYEPATNAYNYGGRKINAYAGSVFYPAVGLLKNTRLSVEYGLPLYQNLNGYQMTTSGILQASLSILFK